LKIALWPPPNEYFFYVDNVPPRERKEIEGHAEAIEIAERKKKIPKILRVLEMIRGHPCADDIEDVEAFIVRTRRNNYVACVRIPVSGIPRYSILYSHPNASDLSDHLVGVPNLIDMARFHKCDVYSYDYCGYGISSGYASESNMKADIRAVYDVIFFTCAKRNPDQIVLIGYSIGCFASVDLACSITRPPAGLILQSPPASVLRVLLWERACFKKPFERQSCCADRFCTYDKIAGVRVPILVIHGEDDRTVPLVHGKAVCQKAAAPLWLRASHDNVENCRETWLRIRKFIK
uniref:Hydrolase_4 domain-containing protein n=1 Tax=Haemonchus placei TaxID=6290 RepID=A0A0N4XBB7_HAEPC